MCIALCAMATMPAMTNKPFRLGLPWLRRMSARGGRSLQGRANDEKTHVSSLRPAPGLRPPPSPPRLRTRRSAPQVKWRLASSFPKSLDTIYGAGAFFCERVGKLTEGRFEITPYAAGQIVPPLQVLDAVQQGTVECGHTASYYYVAKNRAFAFGCAIPFGLTSRQQSAWEYAAAGWSC